MHLSGQWNCRSLRCSWSIACWCCSNYIFILDLTTGFNILHNYNCKNRQKTFKFLDLVWLILEILRFVFYPTLSIPWLLMAWWSKEPRHHQSWYWPSSPGMTAFINQINWDWKHNENTTHSNHFSGQNFPQIEREVALQHFSASPCSLESFSLSCRDRLFRSSSNSTNCFDALKKKKKKNWKKKQKKNR